VIRTINLFTKAVLDTPTSWLDKFSSVWLVGDYYYSSIDGVSYLDGELDPITSQTIEQHLRDCPNCDQAYKTQGSLICAIGNAAPYYKAPAELRERIRSSLREKMAARPMRNVGRDVQPLFPRRQPGPRTVLFGTQWNWLSLAGLGLAAAIIFAAIIAVNLVPRWQRPAADQFLATQLMPVMCVR